MSTKAPIFYPIVIVCVFLRSDVIASATDLNAPKVLVFGGNRLLGAETVELLLASGYNVTIVNRGNTYWDSEKKIFGHVNSIVCDRRDGFKNCQGLTSLMQEKAIYFDAVVDFSASQENDVNEALEIINDKVGLYILKSTTLVYDVCNVHHKHGENCKETESVRPEDESVRKSLEAIHYLGHNMLAGEEQLEWQRKKEGVPYVVLRLPDVIGPRDDTMGYRFWMYVLWLKIQSKIANSPVTIPEGVDKYAFSMVYSIDVAKLILKLLSREIQGEDEIYNLAWTESTNLKLFLEDLRTTLNVDTDIVTLTQEDHRYQFYWYPSYTSGPVDSEKAVEKLNWSPTPFKEALKETVDFYEAAMKDEKFETQMNEVVQILENRLTEKDSKHELYNALEELYDISLSHFKFSHDEL